MGRSEQQRLAQFFLSIRLFARPVARLGLRKQDEGYGRERNGDTHARSYDSDGNSRNLDKGGAETCMAAGACEHEDELGGVSNIEHAEVLEFKEALVETL